MQLMSIVCVDYADRIVKEIGNIKDILMTKNVKIGVIESVQNKTHYIKILCGNYNIKVNKMFNLYMANIIYNVAVDSYFDKNIDQFLDDTYFFLSNDEVNDIKIKSLEAVKNNKNTKIDDDTIFYINKKNDILKKIVEFIEEYKEINIKGFITFRFKEFFPDIEEIINKVVENYMAEKEYSEFIKLLKYFVEIQDSKIDELNIIILQNGNYLVEDKKGNNIMSKLLDDISDIKLKGNACIEDFIISGLITNSPKKIIIHCPDNCRNKEFLSTVKKVFCDRLEFCSGCKKCSFSKCPANI